MSEEDNESVVRRFDEEVINTGNLDLVDDLFDKDFVDHHRRSGPVEGRDELRSTVSALRSAFPDIHVEAADIFGHGDKIVERWGSVGTHQGRFLGILPGGKRVTVSGISIFYLRNGKITDRWLEWDRDGLVRQMTHQDAPSLL